MAKRYAAPEFGQKSGHWEFGFVSAGQPPIVDDVYTKRNSPYFLE